MDSIRVFVADNHPISLEGLICVFARDEGFEIAGSAESVKAAITGINQHEPILAILNVSTGGIRTRAIASEIQGSVKILTISSEVTADIILAALQNGASGFLPLTCSTKDLVESAKRVARGEDVIPPTIATVLADGIRRASNGIPVPHLSHREHEVLTLTAEGHTMKEVGFKVGISPRTVQTHLHKAYTKLDVNDRASAVAKAMKLGLLSNV